MSTNKKTAARNRQHKQSRVSWFAIAGVAVIALIGFFVLTQNHAGAPVSRVALADVNENDVASLQAAERGALGTPVLIWFHAPWCEICQALKRQGTVTALEKQYAGKVRVVMVDISTESGQPYGNKYRVFGTPTWVLFKPNGQVTTQFSGWPGSNAVAHAFDQVLALP